MSPTDLPRLELNRDARIEIWRIGNDQQPVFIVDNALQDIGPLVDFAWNTPFGAPAETSLYPGLNAHLPENYLPAITQALHRPLVEVFEMPHGGVRRSFGFLGLSHIAPDRMGARQALPHTDSANLHSFATVHFLSTGFGGTAFYRHKATGMEVVPATRAYEFNTVRKREIEAETWHPGQPFDDLYEEIAYVEPVVNRLILYRATQLHSARMANTHRLSTDPARGRLTANTFMNV